MTNVIKALHYGRPLNTKNGFMYLRLRKFHWKIDSNTRQRIKQRGWIKPGNVIRVKDTVKGRPARTSVYAIKRFNDKDSKEYLRLFPKMKSVVSARNPHNHNRALINHTLRGMYNFYINHLQEAKEQSAEEVLCKKAPDGKFVYRFK